LVPFTLCQSLRIPGLITKDWQIRGALVPVTAIECVTKTQVRFDIAAAIRGDALVLQTAKEELSALAENWDRPEWKELDWTKIKDLQFLDLYEARKRQIRIAEDSNCTDCPNFQHHVMPLHIFLLPNSGCLV